MSEPPLTEREKALIQMTMDAMREEFAAMLEQMARDARGSAIAPVAVTLRAAAATARKLNAEHRLTTKGGRA